jgi:hypothetical protein
MAEIFSNVIQSDGIELMNNIRANLGSTGTTATNETQHSLRIEIKQEGLKYKMQMFGRPFFMSVETGRKPTPDKKPSRQMIDRLKQWCDARGINESAAWAIATKINKQGTALWRKGGREDIVTPAIDEFQSDVSTHLLDAAADQFIVKIHELQW